MEIEYRICEMNADYDMVLNFMNRVNLEFTPSLEKTINLPEYVRKITQKAVIFLAIDKIKIVGMAAVYLNQLPDYSFGTFLGVQREYRKQEIAFRIEENIIEYFKEHNTKGIKAVVNCDNLSAVKFHKYFGFKVTNKFFDEDLGIDRYEFRLDFQ